MKKHSKPYKAIISELEKGVITKGRITGIKRALNNQYRVNNGWSISVTATKITDDELNDIMQRIEKNPPRVSDDMAKQGIEWLRKLCNTPRGVERKNNPFSDRQARIISPQYFSHFTLAGFYEVSPGHHYPIYTVHSITGLGLQKDDSFSYTPLPWQISKNQLIFQ